MRDGIQLWIQEKLVPSWLRSQEPPKDEETNQKVVEKLLVARDKGHISMGTVKLLIFFFDVPKGVNDIRMVYDGTKSGLNAALWAPWFPLPTVDSLLQSVGPGTYMSDNDVGEMFLNFVLHASIQEQCGVDLTGFFQRKSAMKAICIKRRRCSGSDERGVPWDSGRLLTKRSKE
jgi:hypothetical protein